MSAAPTIVINTTGKPPLNTFDQQGFMDLVAKEAFSRIGYTLETIQLPAERGLRNADLGLDDGEMSRVAGLEKLYPNLIRVPEKIMDWEFMLFSKTPVELQHGWQDLEHTSVAFINGWKILEQNVPITAKITKTRTPEQLFTLLDKNRSEYIIYERWGGLLFIKKKYPNVKINHPPLVKKEMFIYLHKKHHELVKPLDAALKSMKQDGSYQAISRKVLKPLQ